MTPLIEIVNEGPFNLLFQVSIWAKNFCMTHVSKFWLTYMMIQLQTKWMQFHRILFRTSISLVKQYQGLFQYHDAILPAQASPLSGVHNGISCPAQMSSLYWNSTQEGLFQH